MEQPTFQRTSKLSDSSLKQVQMNQRENTEEQPISSNRLTNCPNSSINSSIRQNTRLLSVNNINPLKKSDGGLSFISFFILFLIVQIGYYYFYIDAVYLKDYKEELIVIALKKGYSYDNIHGKFVPPLPANMTALEQKINIVGHKNLWIPPVFFYMFTICVYVDQETTAHKKLLRAVAHWIIFFYNFY